MNSGSRLLHFFMLCAGLFVCLGMQGCATRFEKALEDVHTADEALFRFGAPTKTEVLPDGSERREWLLGEEFTVPGQYVPRHYRLGHDRDGYPVTVTRHIWVPEHRVYYFCDVIIITDAAGRVLDRRWRGNSCDRLVYNSLPPAGGITSAPVAPVVNESATLSGPVPN